LCGPGWLRAENGAVAVAAAANLVYALDALTAEFKRSAPDITVTSTVGASGSLFAQIRNGAPFDVLLSADTAYPQQIVAAGFGERSSLRTFATGRLVVWTMRSDLDLSNIEAALRDSRVQKIALAQPKAAPYGRAAEATLQKLSVWTELHRKFVFGENISQTAQFIETGNADIGFVAMSLVLSPRLEQRGKWQEVPPHLYPGVALDHAAVLTTKGAANPAARSFLHFLGTEPARKVLRDFGYGVPN
jgi:molybdate transport system substrate-binding protein